MNIITLSREFGSGGRELGKRLADYLDYDYYDSEIITAVAKKSGIDAGYAEKILENHGWKDQVITLRQTIGSTEYLQSSKVKLLLQQREVIKNIANLEKNCIIVGRNADVILREYSPLNIFVCASLEAKLKRCRQRANESEKLTQNQLIRNMKKIDKLRSQTREIMSGSSWGKRDEYHLTINTTDFDIKELTPAVAEFANCYFRSKI